MDHLILEDGVGSEGADLTLQTAINRHALMVLDRAGGDEAAAAELLGITEEELKSHLALTEPEVSA
jgi:ParB-like chromosome segregation protein Spo0J